MGAQTIVIVAAILASVVGCADSNEKLCTPPKHTIYSCAPLPAGSTGCSGGPQWRAVGSGSGTLNQDDVNLVFPAGCNAEIPDCSPYYMGTPRTFSCGGDHWVELL